MPMPEANAKSRQPANPASLVQTPSPAETGQSTAAIKARVNYPFLLAHSPADWEVGEVDGKPTWLPVLYPVEIRPGVNGVRTLDRAEQREQHTRDAIRFVENRGHIAIPPTLHVEAKFAGPLGEGPYMRKIPCRERANDPVGSHYIEVWDVPIATPPGEDQAFDTQRGLRNAWRAYLVEAGVIPQPSQLVMERLKRRASQRTGRVQSQPYPDAALKKERLAKAAEHAKAHDTAAIPGAKGAAA